MTNRGISAKKRRRIYRRDGNQCVYVENGVRCTETRPELLTIEHKWPLSHGGSNRDENLETMCKKHNQRRNTEFQNWLNGMDQLTYLENLPDHLVKGGQRTKARRRPR